MHEQFLSQIFYQFSHLKKLTVHKDDEDVIRAYISKWFKEMKVNKSEIYANLLIKKNIKHVVLNAKNHENEAEIIANAGKEQSVIITTSISGRGVDIQLGGKKGSIQDDQLKIDKDKIYTIIKNPRFELPGKKCNMLIIECMVASFLKSVFIY